MRAWSRAFTWTAYSAAIGAVTLTPLMGFVVGDRKPSASATALQMLIAVLLMLVSLTLTIIDRRRRALAFHRRAAALAATRDAGAEFAAARKQAHDAGLPWVEADGSISWSAHAWGNTP
ncbi:putative membrane protein [Actinoplanes campanulatus]|uniref:Putative membrane protein n=1 Tax=Actinoplanes campanulatus TaxID=113559 RepID=A0A7W5AND3_9ACTN|nr:hypothetical protein [Actinoplanes campanulatus]MBB3098969.1 putative membrane protein [Actinoplanes campanulatus]GGN39645.1 hypothetical protein GCM10010109_67810 [Actinoplanes campanulatus]GID40142.1 hypothetical protein Aca09nite_66480 [Actinoplanes campanulatus]